MRTLGGILLGILIVLGWQGIPANGQPAPPYSRFAGTWVHHGGIIHISANGSGSDTFRTYINCTSRIQTACDRFIGNSIYNGGYLRFRLTKIAGNTATGSVTGSAFSWQLQTPVRVTLRSNDTITLKVPGLSEAGCGPHAPNGACGA